MVDELAGGDLTPSALAARLAIAGNLLAHHLGVLEDAGLVTRRVSEGDGRRRYVVLRRDALDAMTPTVRAPAGTILFVCTHNSARSQFARALWTTRTGRPAESAGTDPADRIHPLAVRVAAEQGIDISGERPCGYSSLDPSPDRRSDLVISVCDLAGEANLPQASRHLHWSVPDPVRIGGVTAFRRAFAEISARIDTLAAGAPHDP
jgi:protein-tyrosine-phosphatase